ncbi:MAG: hypothetical protein OEY56_02705 [Cyclobacteriaceae bacterium]|nr:hypothetical protein [Cyclobacteriaceae bacterium]
MKLTGYFKLGVVLAVISLSQACNNDSKNQLGPLLAGKISGKQWEYRYAKSMYASFTNSFETELFGLDQQEQDPCSIFLSPFNYVTMNVPNSIGYFQIPADLNVYFELEGTTANRLMATSGYLEVISIDGRRIGGYLQAVYDDSTQVEGSVIFDRCY